MLRFGAFPKKWEDNYEEYDHQKGEYWLEPKYWKNKKVN